MRSKYSEIMIDCKQFYFVLFYIVSLRRLFVVQCLVVWALWRAYLWALGMVMRKNIVSLRPK